MSMLSGPLSHRSAPHRDVRCRPDRSQAGSSGSATQPEEEPDSGRSHIRRVVDPLLAREIAGTQPARRNDPPFSVGHQAQGVDMKDEQRRPMPDADEGGRRLLQQAIEQAFGFDIDGGRRLVEEDEAGLRHQRTREADALLLAERELPAPVLLGVETSMVLGEIAEADAFQDRLEVRVGEIVATLNCARDFG
jgi:hypothetical protein